MKRVVVKLKYCFLDFSIDVFIIIIYDSCIFDMIIIQSLEHKATSVEPSEQHYTGCVNIIIIIVNTTRPSRCTCVLNQLCYDGNIIGYYLLLHALSISKSLRVPTHSPEQRPMGDRFRHYTSVVVRYYTAVTRSLSL